MGMGFNCFKGGNEVGEKICIWVFVDGLGIEFELGLI